MITETVDPCEQGQMLIDGIRANASVDITGIYLMYFEGFRRHRSECPICDYSMRQALQRLDEKIAEVVE